MSFEQKAHTSIFIAEAGVAKNSHWSSGHIGKCCEMARQTVWLPGLSSEIEDTVGKCQSCCMNQAQKTESMMPSTFLELPWQKVGMDLFEWQKLTYLIIVDYYPRFIEKAKLDRATADAVILHCKNIFSRHSIPEEVLLRIMGHSFTPMHSVGSQKGTSFTM